MINLINTSKRALKQAFWHFPDGTVIKDLTVNPGDARDTGLIPESGRSPGVRNGNPLQYSCLENSMGRGAWWAQPMGLQRVGYDWACTHEAKADRDLPFKNTLGSDAYATEIPVLVHHPSATWKPKAFPRQMPSSMRKFLPVLLLLLLSRFSRVRLCLSAKALVKDDKLVNHFRI